MSEEQLTADYIKSALLQFNYLPLQKENKEELPDVFTSETFTPVACDKLIEKTKVLRKGGYDQCNYSITRFNNIHRKLSIPHPLPYAYLVDHLTKYWSKLSHIEKNKNSEIKPCKHKDNRLIVMNYNDVITKIIRYQKSIEGKKFILKTDISTFFPSIYTHAIPWALLGFEKAKESIKNNNKGNANKSDGEYANELDYYQRMTSRNETVGGVAVGPATSNIISEIILGKIDEQLTKNKDCFYRFIDDYTFFCETYEQAEEIILKLSQELERFRLQLNIRKTEIKKLPQPSTDSWLHDINIKLQGKSNININFFKNMIDYAINLQAQNMDGSVLKYTIKTLIAKIEVTPDLSITEWIHIVANLCSHYPILLPLLDSLFTKPTHFPASYDGTAIFEKNRLHFNYVTFLNTPLNNCIINRNSDGMVWCLYYFLKYFDSELSDNTANKIIKTEDCMAITMLSLFKQHKKKVIKFASKVAKKTLYEMDQYWILLYQLYFNGDISNPYEDEKKYYNLFEVSEEKNYKKK